MRNRIVPVAQLFTGWVKEATGQNDGAWVEAILRLVDQRRGAPWCAAFVCLVLDIAYRGQNPLPRTASCDVLLTFARAKGWLFEAAEPGDVFLLLKTKTDAVHTGFVAAVSPAAVKTIEGNTNAGGSRDGWGVFARERLLQHLVFLRIPDVIPTEMVGRAGAPAPT